MRSRVVAIAALCSLGLLGAGGTSAVAAERSEMLARQVLPDNDGWASSTTGTTGGSAADAAHVFHATTRQELVDALGGSNKTNDKNATPKIVLVEGVIDGNVDASNQHVDCSAYQDPAFTWDAYKATFDPAVWGRTSKVSGPVEDARKRSETNQANQIQIRVGSNTTIMGVGSGATMVGINLLIQNVDNVIVRNVTFVDAADCFPQWDPTDGSLGNWNSAFDNVSVIGTTHVWVDHSSFTDGPNPDSDQPLVFGRPLQVHDGELDITKAADLVTVEWNAFLEHDKTMLIGSSDNSPADVGKLRVTVHHNVFNDIGQRAPRVRFGQVHVYNNLYEIPNAADYTYTWGVGIQSQTFAQNNFFQATAGVEPAQFITVFKGTAMHAEGTLVNGLTPSGQVDVVAAYNAAKDPDLGTDVGWTPTLFKRIDPTVVVPFRVGMFAGADRL